MIIRGFIAILSAAVCVLTFGGQTPTTPPAAERPDTLPADAGSALPSVADAKPRDYAGLLNVVAYFDRYLSGGAPEGIEGLHAIASLGVKTIISVDGAEPDAAAARSLGMRYIHLPIGYNGFDEKRKLELVRASRDAMREGPVYVHCHHGKHRSAGAAGAVAVSLGWLTPQKALERMNVSGTAPNYTGLFSATANATVIDASIIDAVPADFPEVCKPASFVKSMVEIDIINDRLKLIEKAGWRVPDDHPDLVPAAEAGRMADLFRFAAGTEKIGTYPAAFADALRDDSLKISQLEQLLAANVRGEFEVNRMSDLFRQVQASCKQCHISYRD